MGKNRHGDMETPLFKIDGHRKIEQNVLDKNQHGDMQLF